MSLALFLLVKDITQTAAAAAQIASSVATINNINNVNRARAEAMGAHRSPVQGNVGTYDIDLFLAKVAMLSYIAKVDRVISYEERNELEQTLNVAQGIYGSDAVIRARRIFESEAVSFIALESYLRKVKDSDLDSFIFYSEEYAKTDNKMTPEEADALDRLRNYIESRKGKKSFDNLTCPSCSGAMHPDQYGYKATCAHCGYEIVLNTDNSPYKSRPLYICTSCGVTYDGSRGKVNFCRKCGGRVIGINEQSNVQSRNAANLVQNSANLYISYTSNNSNVVLVTRIVSLGTKYTLTTGETKAFCLLPGRQTIILKIGRKNHSRDIVIPQSNSPVRIYTSFDGMGHITIDQPQF